MKKVASNVCLPSVLLLECLVVDLTKAHVLWLQGVQLYFSGDFLYVYQVLMI